MHKHEFQVLADTIGRGTVSHIPQRHHVHESLGKIDCIVMCCRRLTSHINQVGLLWCVCLFGIPLTDIVTGILL